jgi:hypothetical protein
MAGRPRSLLGHVANISTWFLRMVNMIIVFVAAATIVIMFIIEHSPSFPAGWGFVVLGCATVVSGIFGAVSSGQMGCFTIHLFCLFISSAGLCASFVIIFLRTSNVVKQLNYKTTKYKATQLLRVEGALFLILFACQMVVLLLACLIQSCGFIDYYEDLEATNAPKSAKQLAKEQAEDAKRRSKLESSSAHVLAEKMKKKYGQWAKEGESDVESQGSRSIR